MSCLLLLLDQDDGLLRVWRSRQKNRGRKNIVKKDIDKQSTHMIILINNETRSRLPSGEEQRIARQRHSNARHDDTSHGVSPHHWALDLDRSREGHYSSTHTSREGLRQVHHLACSYDEVILLDLLGFGDFRCCFQASLSPATWYRRQCLR